MQPLFSISIICKNEENSFPNLHASLKEFISLGGEVVVIDTGSTDGTIEVLKGLGYVDSDKYTYKLRYQSLGSKFVIDLSDNLESINSKYITGDDEKFTAENTKLSVFDFCSARKYAGKSCKNKWVLSVDCDEVFTALDIQKINAVIESEQYNQISFTFRYMGGNGEAYSITSRDKLYNREESDWRWLVHEQVKNLPGSESNIVNVSEDILALSHYQHDAEHRSNYLLSMCIDVSRDPNDQHVFWLGREFHNRGYHHSAATLLTRYLKEYPQAWSAERCMAAVYAGDAHMDISKKCEDEIVRKFNEVEALKFYFAATVYESSFREPWLRLGYYYVSKAEHMLAVTFITAALNLQCINKNYMNDVGYCHGYLPFQKLYISLFALGNKKAAFDTWKKAKIMFPSESSISDHEVLFRGM